MGKIVGRGIKFKMRYLYLLCKMNVNIIYCKMYSFLKVLAVS